MSGVASTWVETGVRIVGVKVRVAVIVGVKVRVAVIVGVTVALGGGRGSQMTGLKTGVALGIVGGGGAGSQTTGGVQDETLAPPDRTISVRMVFRRFSGSLLQGIIAPPFNERLQRDFWTPLALLLK